MRMRWSLALMAMSISLLHSAGLIWSVLSGSSDGLTTHLVWTCIGLAVLAGGTGFVIGTVLGHQVDRALGLLKSLDSSSEPGRSCEWTNLLWQLKRTVTTVSEERRRLETEVGSRATSIHGTALALGTSSAELMASVEVNAEESQRAASSASQVSANVRQIADSAEGLVASVREIAGATAETSRISTTAAGRSKEVDAVVRRLAASSEDIGSVVKAISTVAEQTNLLALNASIEAARAGESGRGFAVVAGEVKTLASQTALATADISRRIAAIQQDTALANQAIADIGALIERIDVMQQTVAAAVEEQSATTADISQRIGEAAKGSEDIAGAIATVAGSVRNEGGIAMAVRDLSSQLSAGVEALVQQCQSGSSSAPVTGAPASTTARNTVRLLTWGPEYATGHTGIDTQHEQLFRITGELHVAMRDGRGRRVIGDLVNFLADYTARHFAEEEEVMRRAAYPQLASHQELHRTLLSQVADLQRRFAAGEQLKTMDVSEFLANWLSKHILQVDHAYVEHLKAAKVM